MDFLTLTDAAMVLRDARMGSVLTGHHHGDDWLALVARASGQHQAGHAGGAKPAPGLFRCELNHTTRPAHGLRNAPPTLDLSLLPCSSPTRYWRPSMTPPPKNTAPSRAIVTPSGPQA